MANDPGALDTLLAQMPEIAKAVAAFPKRLQQTALEELIAAAGAQIRAAHDEREQAQRTKPRKTKPVQDEPAVERRDTPPVVIRYRINIVDLDPATQEHVYSEYQRTGWRLPRSTPRPRQAGDTGKRHLQAVETSDTPPLEAAAG